MLPAKANTGNKTLQIMSMPWGGMAFQYRGGEETPLLLLHGTGCDSGDWAGVAGALPPEKSIIEMDFRGHGGSDIPRESFTLSDLAGDALSLLAHLRVEKAVLAGHSLGGMVAMDAAARSDRVAGLVLLEGWTCLDAAGAFGSNHHFGGLIGAARRAVAARHEQVVSGFAPEAWTRFWSSVSEFSARQFLAGATLPVCEVYGTLDFSADGMERLAIPSRLRKNIVWVEGAGHYLPREKPREVAGIFRDFMCEQGFWTGR